jgi:hypothetical protein
VAQIAPHVPRGACVAAPGYSRAAIASLEQYGRWRVDTAANSTCAIALRNERRGAVTTAPLPPGWEIAARVRRPTDRDEVTLVLSRTSR